MEIVALSQKKKILYEVHSAGTLFLSNLFNASGFGILTVQVYLFTLAFPQETWRMKSLVYGVYLLELAQTVELSRTMYHLFVQSFLEQDALDHIFDMWFSIPITGGLVACVVQLFYVWRIYQLQGVLRNRVISYVVISVGIILSVGQLIGSIALGIQLARIKLFSLVKSVQIEWPAGIWLCGECVCDIIIAGCMTHILLRKVGDGQDDTRARARRVISLTIGNGVLTAAGAIINIILIVHNGRQLYYQASATEVSKLYSNTLMVTLNSRIYLRSGNSRVIQNVPMSTLKFETMPVESEDLEEEFDLSNRSISPRSIGGDSRKVQRFSQITIED